MEIVLLVVGLGLGLVLGGVISTARRTRVEPAAVARDVPQAELADLRSAFEAMAVGVVVVDETGSVLVRNRAATSLGGARHSDVLLQESLETLLAAAARGETRQQQLDLHGPPHKVVMVRARPIEGGAMATVEDITERARLDAVRTDFVANISHELRTPVGALALLAETLCHADEPEVVQRLSSKMVDEAHRVARALDDLLELSRIELGGEAVRDEVDVVDVIDGALDRVRPLAESRDIEVRARCARGRLCVFGDRRQLVSALGNLLENAVKYSEPGRPVTIEATARGSEVELSVVDEGIGIPARDLDRIFERFYRVDRARSRETGGTGLGLAIVRHVVTNHGGRVTVQSREGEGSTFVLHLPGQVPRPKGGPVVPTASPEGVLA